MFTVCMIVKNEEPVIEKSLKSIKGYGCDIVLVDTGSEDNTKEIASKYTDKIYDYKWDNNFSNARNFAVEKTKDEFILMIDADEVIVNFNKGEVERLINLNKDKIGRISIINEFRDDNILSKSIEKVSRVFSKNFYKYNGSIHEQLISIKNKKGYKYELPIKIIHSGYDLVEISRKDKVNRNLSMLNKELDLNKNDPYILYQLGKTCYMAKDYEKASQYFKMTMDIDLDVKLEYVQDLIECYGYSLINTKKYLEALNLQSIYNIFCESSDFVFLMGLIYMNNGQFSKAVNEFLKASNMDNAKVVGVNDNLSFYNVGIIYECLGETGKAQEYYLKCKKYKPALDRIKIMNKKL